MKRNWQRWAVLGLCVVLLAAAGRIIWLEQAVSRLEEDRLRTERELDSVRDRLAAVSEALRQAERETQPTGRELVAKAFALLPTAVDPADRTVRLKADLALTAGGDSAFLTLYREGAERTLLQSAPLSADGGGHFSGELTLPTDAGWISVRLTADTGGRRRSEELYTGPATGLLAVGLDSRSVDASYAEGTLSITGQVRLKDGLTPGDAEFRVYKNGTPAITFPALSGGDDGEANLRGGGALYCGEGDLAELRFACTDELGLAYEFSIREWMVRAGGELETRWPATAGPQLIWPE